jgi:hypothetical protein
MNVCLLVFYSNKNLYIIILRMLKLALRAQYAVIANAARCHCMRSAAISITKYMQIRRLLRRAFSQRQ